MLHIKDYESEILMQIVEALENGDLVMFNRANSGFGDKLLSILVSRCILEALDSSNIHFEEAEGDEYGG